VLEAISGIPFPTNDGLCTRFATEVVLRRTNTIATDVRIIRDTQFSVEDAAQKSIDQFHSEVEAMSPFGMQQIPQIVTMAANALQLGNDKNFTKDFLRIEVAGPTQDHLTLVDLPGLFSTTKHGQNDGELGIVRNLALKYMAEKRSIILAVLSAKNDYANQEIMQTLKGIDPAGSRTLGVITGLDSIERFSAREQEYLDLVHNDLTPLTLGWHALRNLSFTDRQNGFGRDRLESDFFNVQEPWCDLDDHICGAAALKTRLSNVLMDHIGRELKSVIATLDEKIVETEMTLSKCGIERDTPQLQREYLGTIGNSYHLLVKAALEGPYEDKFFSTTGQRLREIIRQRNEMFVKKMHDQGQRWIIEKDSSLGAMKHKNVDISRGMSLTDPPLRIKESSYLHKVDKLLREHRGRELQGTFDPLLVGTLFRDQSCRWRYHAASYVQDIATWLGSFLYLVIEYLTDSIRTRTLLLEHLHGLLSDREDTMKARLDMVLSPFEKSQPTTYNPLMGSKNASGSPDQAMSGNKRKLATLTDEVACRLLMDSMQSYYNIAVHTFVDNVVTLGVELCLLDGLEDLFTPMTVLKMSDEEMKKLASESPEDIMHRRTTEKRLQKFKAGREVCKKYVVADPMAMAGNADGGEETVVNVVNAAPSTPSHMSKVSSHHGHSSQDSVTDASSSGCEEEEESDSTPATTPERPVKNKKR
jgi:hypothetical protein